MRPVPTHPNDEAGQADQVPTGDEPLRDSTRANTEIQAPPEGPPGTPTRVDNGQVEPAEPAATTGSSAGGRGKLRRRLRKLRGIRARQWAELGALVVDARKRSNGSRPEVLERRAAEAAEVDRQVRSISSEIHTLPDERVLATGIAGTCRECGELLSTEDGFCPTCGTPASPGRKRPADPASAAQQPAFAQPAPPPVPAPAQVAPSMPPPPSDLLDAQAPPPPPDDAPLAHVDPATIPPPPPPR